MDDADRVERWRALPVVRELARDVVQAGLAVGLLDHRGQLTWVREAASVDETTWSSARSPIRDPDSGVVLGGVVVAGPAGAWDPDVDTLARLTAATLEGELRLSRRLAYSA